MRFSLFIPLLLTACYAAPATATKAITWGDTKEPLSVIWVEELENDPDGCVAKVFFKNYNLHNATAENIWDLDLYTSKVRIELDVDPYSADTLYVKPDEPYFAWPEYVVVPEDETDYVCIYKNVAIG